MSKSYEQGRAVGIVEFASMHVTDWLPTGSEVRGMAMGMLKGPQTTEPEIRNFVEGFWVGFWGID